MSDQEYRRGYMVEKLPQSVREKIAEFHEASTEYAFIGAADPRDHGAIEDEWHAAREALEITIVAEIAKGIDS